MNTRTIFLIIVLSAWWTVAVFIVGGMGCGPVVGPLPPDCEAVNCEEYCAVYWVYALDRWYMREVPCAYIK